MAYSLSDSEDVLARKPHGSSTRNSDPHRAADRLQRLRTEILLGQYQVPSEEIAESLLRRLVSISRKNPVYLA